MWRVDLFVLGRYEQARYDKQLQVLGTQIRNLLYAPLKNPNSMKQRFTLHFHLMRQLHEPLNNKLPHGLINLSRQNKLRIQPALRY
jgi:hypothetical protein